MKIEKLQQDELLVAKKIISLSFGTFFGDPDPESFWSDIEYAATRYYANPSTAFAIKDGDQLIGSNFVTRWGSVGFFGPMTVHPEYWESGAGQLLLKKAVECFDEWGLAHTGLFTFAHSPKHIHLYQKLGFWPRFLTAIMIKDVPSEKMPVDILLFSQQTGEEQTAILKECHELTNEIYEGLDLGLEINAVNAQKLGDTVLLYEYGELIGFAVCHCGEGSEAGRNKCYVKFAAVIPGGKVEARFNKLLLAVENYAVSQKVGLIEAGINLACISANNLMKQRDYKTDILGVAMMRNNDKGYHHEDSFVIDDWR